MKIWTTSQRSARDSVVLMVSCVALLDVFASTCCSGDVDPRKAVKHNSAVLEANGGMCAENSP